MEPEIDSLAGVANDVFGTRILRVSPAHQVLHLVDVERRHDLGKSQVLGDGSGDSDLVNSQVRIRGDDGSRGEVHTLSHQVTTNPALLSLEPGLEGLERSAGLLHGLGQPGHVVVSHGGHVELQHLDILR